MPTNREYPLTPKFPKAGEETKKGSPKPVIISVLRTSFFVIPLRFERKTHALEGRCSIQLSYGTSLKCGAKLLLFYECCKYLL